MPHKLARWSLHATAVLPLAVLPGFYFPYVTPRAVGFRLLTTAAAICFLWWLARSKLKLVNVRDPVLIGLTAFVLVAILSSFFGVAPWRSLFGDFERMWGAAAWLHLLLYYVLLRTFFEEQDWRVFFRVLLIAGGAANVSAVLEWALTGNPRPSGTLGNPGYLAAFDLVLIAIAIHVWLYAGRNLLDRYSALWAFTTGLTGFYFAQTRGALVGVLCAAAWALTFGLRKKSRIVVAARVALLLSVAVVLLASQTSLVEHLPVPIRRLAATTFDQSESVRLIGWRVALNAAADRPMLGWGIENANIAFNRHFDPSYYLAAGSGSRLDRFHNVALEVLTTTGLLGALAFLGMWLGFFYRLRRARDASRIDEREYALFTACFIAYAVYLLFWFEDLASFAALLALAAYVSHRSDVRPLFEAQPGVSGGRTISTAGIAVFASYAIVHCVLPLRAAYFLERADAATSGSVERRIADFNKALSPAVPQQMHTLMRYAQFIRTTATAPENARMNRYQQQVLALAIAQLRLEIDAARRRDPLNEVWPLLQGQLATTAFAVWRSSHAYREALEEFLAAVELSPRRVRHRYTVARTYLLIGDTTHAIAQLDTAIRIFPRLGESYAELSALYARHGDARLAAAYAHEALARRFRPSVEEIVRINAALTAEREYARAVRLNERSFAAAYGERWHSPAGQRVNAEDRDLLIRHVLLNVEAGNLAKAERLASVFAARDTSDALLSELAEDIRAGNIQLWLTGQKTGQSR
ncbi:MAG: O-antigen ligase family protein [Gemmatimonadota bacterium]